MNQELFNSLCIILFIALIVFLFKLPKIISKKKSTKNIEQISRTSFQDIAQKEENVLIQDEKYPYKFKYLFTKNELHFYDELLQRATVKGYNVMAKVRLADLIEVDTKQAPTKKEQSTYFHKISQKHVDFILVNKGTCKVEKIIEIDDNSHLKLERQQRDIFVDAALKKANYQVYHVRNISELDNVFN